MNTVVIPAINPFPMSALFSYWTVPHMYHKMNVHSILICIMLMDKYVTFVLHCFSHEATTLSILTDPLMLCNSSWSVNSVYIETHPHKL